MLAESYSGSLCQKWSNFDILRCCTGFLPTIAIQDIFRTVVLYSMFYYLPVTYLCAIMPVTLAATILGFVFLFIVAEEGADKFDRHRASMHLCKALCIGFFTVVIIPITTFFLAFILLMALPSSYCLHTYLYSWEPCIARIFRRNNPIVTSILKYTMNTSSSTETKRRIIACTYQTVLKSRFKDYSRKTHKLELLNSYAMIHNLQVGKGLDTLQWYDIIPPQHEFRRDDLAFATGFIILFIFNFTLIAGLLIHHFHVFPKWLQTIAIVYCMVEAVFLALKLKIGAMIFYCYHLSECFRAVSLMDSSSNFWPSACIINDHEIAEIIMENILDTYDDLFGCTCDVAAMLEKYQKVPKPVGNIVMTYAWAKLETFH